MFDTVGRDLDPEGGRRRAWASMWATFAVGGLLGAAVGVAALRVAAPGPAEAPPAPIAQLVEVPDDVPDAPPPGLPDRPRGGDAAPAAPAPPAPPESAPDVPPPLDPDVSDAVADAGPTSPDGPGTGPGTGTGTGTGSGTGSGSGGGGGGGGDTRTVHSSDLRAKRRVEPRYPEAARALHLGEQRCRARVSIGADGVPTDVEVSGCPAVFHPDTEVAIRGWRWWPPRVDGRPAAVVTTIVVVYRLDGR